MEQIRVCELPDLLKDAVDKAIITSKKSVSDYYNYKPSVKITYFGDQIDVAADAYDNGTLRINLFNHLNEMNLGKIKKVLGKSILAKTQKVAFGKDWLRREK